MQMITISEIMVKDHDKIEKLINDFSKCLDFDMQILIKAFESFKWEIEKHLFTEEKVIFTYHGKEDYILDNKTIPKLILEHNKIHEYLKEIKKDIKLDKECNFQGLKEILFNHKNFEEKEVYPKIDQKLDESTKERIIKRINEIKLTDNGLRDIKAKCSECDKKLGIMEGYYYPKFNKRWFFCKKCYDKIEEKDK